MNSSNGAAELVVHGVGKTFPSGVTAIADIGFTVSHGEFVALLGPSGCGKSTVLRIVAGLTPPSRGAVSFKSKAVSGPPAGMIYVFQQYTKSLFPWLTVLDNLMFGAESPH